MSIPESVLSLGPAAVTTYKAALPYGERWAEMCALQCPPGTRGSDRAFLEGRQNNEQFDTLPKRQAQYMIREAKRAGINPTGKYYCSGIADGRGWRDPAAWVSGNDDVLKVAKARRMAVAGSVNYDPGPAPPQRKLLADSIVNEEVRRAKRQNPTADARELRAKIVEKHAYRAKGRGV